MGLYCYHGKIRISGKENVPKDLPVMFLPNHQSALMDVLLLAVDCNRKPWFLTRSDIFKKPTLKKFFAYLQMIPIYRIRDGRESLKNNEAVFTQCAELLEKNEAILMFPEANHNIKRRVRSLSKGFTRILFGTLNRSPNLDIQIVPIGLNYKDAKGFPDHVAINFGKPIAIRDLYKKDDIKESTQIVKDVVSGELKKLTTHIEDEENYDTIIARLQNSGVEYLNPIQVNEMVQKLENGKISVKDKENQNLLTTFFKFLFTVLNLPLVLGWRYGMKPRVWEPEFTGTLRFAYAMLATPLYYLLVFTIMAFLFTPLIGVFTLMGLFVFNWLYVKLA